MPQLTWTCRSETWPLAAAFTISRGSKTEARVVVVTVSDGTHQGVGEGVPYPRYGETVEQSLAELGRLAIEAPDLSEMSAGAARRRLGDVMHAGAARNALDCALLDLEARQTGTPAHALLGLPEPRPTVTCYTIGLDTAKRMAAKAAAVPHLPLLKLKLGGDGDGARMASVRAARPDARLVADANEAWRPELLGELLAAACEARIELIEQPLAQGHDAALSSLARPVPVAADETFHGADDLALIAGRYDAVNVKLDKTGGVTAAADVVARARAAGLKIMIGSMVSTSLSMAPALLLAAQADWIDLDSPLLLAADRVGGLVIRDGVIHPAAPGFWG